MFALGDTGSIPRTGHSGLFMTHTLKISVCPYIDIYLAIYRKSPLVSVSLAKTIGHVAPYIQYI